MKHCLIHIGSPKTGTSSIQRTLFENSAKLQAVGCSYPTLRVGGKPAYNHNFFSTLDLPYERAQREFTSRFGADEYPELCESYWRDLSSILAEQDKVILSSEYLSFLAEPEIRFVKERLKGVGFDKFHIVVYVRDPIRHYLSAVQQKIKASYKFWSPASYRSSARSVLETWEAVFPGCLTVKAFDPENFRSGCVVQDFLSVCESLLGSRVSDYRVIKTNESISLEAMYIMREYRELFHADNEDKFSKDSVRLLKALSALGGEKPALRDDCKMLMKENHLQEIEWLSSQYGLSFSEFDQIRIDPVSTDRYGGEIGGSRYLKDLSLVLKPYDPESKGKTMYSVIQRLAGANI